MAAPIIGTVIGERWRVTDLLGRGGFGQVFACHDESDIALGDAAVKLLHANTTPLERSEFLGEVKQMAKLRHQNLVGYLDSGLHRLGDDVHPFLVTERCTGSLADQLHGGAPPKEGRSTPVGGEQARRILADVLDGLVHLHDRQLVHRDIKPANVLWGDGAWKLADFGLMRELTATGSYHKGDQVVGTPRYMAPELFTAGRATAATDVYAIGVLAHVLLTGQTVHRGTGMALVHAITSTPPTLDPSLGGGWASWIAPALLIDPAARPSARDLRSTLETTTGDPSSPGPGIGAAGAAASTVAVEGRSVQGWAPPPDPPGRPESVPLAPERASSRRSVSVPVLIGGLGVVALMLGLLGWSTLRDDGAEAEIGAVAAGPPTDGGAGAGAEPVAGDGTAGGAGVEIGAGVEVGAGVEIGDGVDIGSSGSGTGSTGPEQMVSPPESHVEVMPCAAGVAQQILITNPDDGHRDYRIEVNHQDADGVRVDEHLVLLKGVAPGETVSAGVVAREDGVAACTVAGFEITPTDAASIEAVEQAELRQCMADGGWYDVVFDITNPGERSVDAEVYVAVIGGDGVRLDEDWAGTSVYGIGPGETVRADESHVFWNLDALGNPEVTCRIVAVEFD